MPPGDTPFRIRATSLLHPFTSVKSSDEDAPGEKLSKSRRASTEPNPTEKPKPSQEGDVTEHAESLSSIGRNGDNPVARGYVRSVPSKCWRPHLASWTLPHIKLGGRENS